jgi:hypothetical protein
MHAALFGPLWAYSTLLDTARTVPVTFRHTIERRAEAVSVIPTLAVAHQHIVLVIGPLAHHTHQVRGDDKIVLIRGLYGLCFFDFLLFHPLVVCATPCLWAFRNLLRFVAADLLDVDVILARGGEKKLVGLSVEGGNVLDTHWWRGTISSQ